MPDNLIVFYAVVTLVALLVGIVKGGFSGIAGVVLVPLLSMIMPVPKAVGLLFPMLLVGDWCAVGAHWRKWDTRLYLQVIPLAIVGVFLGTFVLVTAPPDMLRRVLGVLVLLVALYRLAGSRAFAEPEYHPQGWHGVVVGGISGVGAALAHTGGPPIVLYFLFRGLSPALYASTLVLFFFTLNLVKLPTYLFAGVFTVAELVRIFWILPIIPAGVWLGKWLNSRIDARTFQQVILLFMFAAGGMLLVGG